MLVPVVTVITSTADIPEPTLVARLAALGAAPPEARARVAVQLRAPELGGGQLYRLGLRLRDVTGSLGVALLVNDRLDVALALGADGVHLGRRSVGVAEARGLLGAGVFVSVACHSVDEVLRAADAGADAALLSPIFATPGKGPPLGVDSLREARAKLAAARRRIAVIALGGVDAAAAPACLAAGADGVAAIRADLGGVLPALLAR